MHYSKCFIQYNYIMLMLNEILNHLTQHVIPLSAEKTIYIARENILRL